MITHILDLWHRVWPYGPLLATFCVAAGISVPFLYTVSRNRRKAQLEQTDMEATLLKELHDTNAVQKELWTALGPQRYAQILDLYIKRDVTRARANAVFDYWNRVGRMYAEKRVNRKRFLARIAPDCNATWNNFTLLIEYFEVTQPARIADFKALQKIVAREIERNRQRLDRTAARPSVGEGGTG